MKVKGLCSKFCGKIISAFILVCLMVFSSKYAYPQSYGLGFNGREFSKDLRTSIDLSHDNYLSFKENFELRFKMLLRPNQSMYFGYIIRIIDDNGKNTDLILDYKSIDSSSIKVICCQKLSGISANIDIDQISKNWTEFRLNFDLKNNKVRLLVPETNFQSEDIGANLTGKVKILFGVNDLNRFKTTDVPAMEIKDLYIYEKDKLVYNWPLNEIEGTQTKDLIHGKIAEIKNPVWIKPEHTVWKKISSSILSGNGEIAFNEEDEKIYLIGDDQMIIYSGKNNTSDTVIYKDRAKNLLPGRQAIYNPDTKTIYSYDLDQKMVSEFDPNSREWKQVDPPGTFATIFLHHNKYYSSTEKSLYTFDGYGQHEYKNTIYKLSIETRNWEVIKPSGDTFHPRYLAALGALNDTVFILGGYGSVSGKQILNPQNFYDLMAFSLKNHKFKKIYDFSPPFDDICFSNSMIIDANNRNFYTLSYPALKYEGFLQLMKGSLDNPGLKPIASKIPFLFHDVRSFSSLYYCKSSKKLIAATLLYNEQNLTEFNLFSIAFPPNENDGERPLKQTFLSNWIYSIVLLAVLLILTFYFVFKIKRKEKVSESKTKKGDNNLVNDINELNNESKESFQNTIFFFGGFQVFDRNGEDITNRFTPLLKELFLLIWLFSIKNDKGISSEKLTELLWFDKEEQSAKNNRSVNIAKLKQIISEVDTLNLSHKTAYWKFEFDENIVFNDYQKCSKIIDFKKALSKDYIYKLINLTSKGAFLMNCSYQWLDEFKDDISNRIIDKLTDFASVQNMKEDPDFLLNLADSIFNFDVVNEEAMFIKCKVLTYLGKHSLASNTYTKFAKEYKTLYDQNYKVPFSEIIKSE